MRFSLLALVLSTVQLVWPAECSHPLGFYQNNGFYVADIQILSALGLVKTAISTIDSAKLRLHKRQVDASGKLVEPGLFDTVALSLDNRTVKEEFTILSSRVGLTVTMPSIEQCDEEKRSLVVVYHVLSFNVPVETRGQNIASVVLRSLVPTGAFGGVFDTVFPALAAGYDRTHRLYGGTNTVLRVDAGGLFDSVRLDAIGSSSGSSVKASFSGAHDNTLSPIAHAEWEAGYSRLDEPTGLFQIRQSITFGRVSASTAPFSSLGLISNFGAAVEAGNEQTNVSRTAAVDGPARSPYGALKLYDALTCRLAGSPVSLSYGVQLGKSSPGVSLDYAKHLINVTGSRAWFPNRDHHKAISLEARFAGGFSIGVLPVAERFLGGNRERYFIDGDSWRIADEPFLRSFPANRLTLPGRGIYGGDSFVSANATVAYPLFYHRPLIPDELLKDKDFAPILESALTGATRELENHHAGDAPAFIAFRKEVLALQDPIGELRRLVKGLHLPEAVTADALSDMDDLDGYFTQMRDAKLPDPTSPIVTVAVGFPGVDAVLVTLADDLENVVSALPGSMATQKADLQSRQSVLRKAVRDPVTGFAARYPRLDLSPAKKEAADDMKLATSVLHSFLNELNLVSVSPAVLADAARLGSKLVATNPGWRYGLGPAIRFSLVNVNLTVGYSFNVQRHSGEPRGAFSVALSIGDLFR